MEKRRMLAAILGAIQSIIGVFLVILVVSLFFNIFEIHAILNVNAELLPIYIIFLGLFSSFSILNGFYLIREAQGII